MSKRIISLLVINILSLFLVTLSYSQTTRNNNKKTLTATQSKNERYWEEQNKKHKKAPKDSIAHVYPFFNGLRVGVNILNPALMAFGQDWGSYEGVVEASIHNRFFPEWSFGVGSADKTADNGSRYIGNNAFFNRFGVSYNFRYNSTLPNYFVFSVRYGISSYKADITGLSFSDDYWGSIDNINLYNQKFTSQWVELGAGIRVQVFKNIYMGWTVYVKPLIKSGSTENANPYYIPGYGTYGNKFGVNYNIYYQLPIKTKKPKINTAKSIDIKK
ncbi:MAG: DUF6048 family protein [Bacteroidales bacterium]|nr:DUF6048 family protein [Bacteroidales bacterium]